MLGNPSTSPEAPAPGARLGAYTLERLLGGGGFAWVYTALDQNGKAFALKVLKPRYANDPAFETRFRQEATLAAALDHPHVVRLIEVGNQGGFVFFTMDLYPDTLAARLERLGTLPELDAVDLAIGVARALSFAHAQQVIHRDIKPDNILISEAGQAVLTDFGIARAVSNYVAATGFMMTIGTPHYISPEQAQGRPIDGRSDLYSLGITLYRAVTGELPFKSRDWFELARMHVETPPEPLRTRQPELSKRFERIVLKLLAKHPDDRHRTADELIADLVDVRERTRPTSDIAVPQAYLKNLRDSSAAPEPGAGRKWWKPWS